MKKISSINILFVIILLLICCKKDIREISGFYERDYSNDHYTLELKKNKDFYKSCDNYAMDPCYWYGTYKISGDSIIFNVHEDFLGTNTKRSYYYAYDGNILTLTKDSWVEKWVKTD